jgi:hypothetical protein
MMNRHRKRLITLGAILGIVLIAGAASIAAVAQFGSETARRDDATKAAIAFEPASIDFGTCEASSIHSASVALVNTSDADVRILEAKPGCGCTTVRGFEPTTLAPSERLTVEFEMKAPKKAGRKTKHITFTIEDGEPIRLPLHIEVADDAR